MNSDILSLIKEIESDNVLFQVLYPLISSMTNENSPLDRPDINQVIIILLKVISKFMGSPEYEKLFNDYLKVEEEYYENLNDSNNDSNNVSNNDSDNDSDNVSKNDSNIVSY